MRCDKSVLLGIATGTVALLGLSVPGLAVELGTTFTYQ